MLAKPSSTMALIREHDFRIQKRFGQNFLVDALILEKIIRGADIKKQDHVLEIGPGLGTMTAALAKEAAAVTAVEIDKELIPILEETLAPYRNVRIIQADILKLDHNLLFNEENKGRRIKVVANLPYYITTPIIMALLPRCDRIESITVMVQKEVARRLQSLPGSKDYGSLSLAVSYYADAKILMPVPPSCFIPRPQVDSAVVRLTLHKTPPYKEKDPEALFDLIRAAFGQRRKTLSNALSHSLCLPKERIEAALSAMGFDKAVRGEVLSLEDYILLKRLLLSGNSDRPVL